MKIVVFFENFSLCIFYDIINALNMWRHYPLGTWFVLMSDHIGLSYFLDQLNLNIRQAKWLATINEFDFQIKHIKCKQNRVEDIFHKFVQVHHLVAMSSYGMAYMIGSCRQVNRMSSIWRLCIACSRVVVQIEAQAQVQVLVQPQVHMVWIIVLQWMYWLGSKIGYMYRITVS